MKKKTLSVILAITMILGIFQFQAFASEESADITNILFRRTAEEYEGNPAGLTTPVIEGNIKKGVYEYTVFADKIDSIKFFDPYIILEDSSASYEILKKATAFDNLNNVTEIKVTSKDSSKTSTYKLNYIEKKPKVKNKIKQFFNVAKDPKWAVDSMGIRPTMNYVCKYGSVERQADLIYQFDISNFTDDVTDVVLRERRVERNLKEDLILSLYKLNSNDVSRESSFDEIVAHKGQLIGNAVIGSDWCKNEYGVEFYVPASLIKEEREKGNDLITFLLEIDKDATNFYSDLHELQFIARETANINFSITGNGAVINMKDNQAVENTVKVFAGQKSNFKIEANPGSYIKSIKTDGEEKLKERATSYILDFEPKSESNIEIEFSDDYSFIESKFATLKYTDDTTKEINQKISVSGKADSFLKGKKLTLDIVNQNKETETAEGTIKEDGTFLIEKNSSFSGDVSLSLTLYLTDDITKDIAKGTVTLESLLNINNFVNNLKDIDNFKTEDFVNELKDNGASYGFDTAIFVRLSDSKKTEIVNKMKTGFNFTTIEDTITLYNSIIPYIALNNESDISVLKDGIEKYKDVYKIKDDEVAKEYLSFDDAKKEKALIYLNNKDLDNNDKIIKALSDAVIITEFKAITNYSEIKNFTDKYETKLEISNIDDYKKLNSNKKRDLYKELNKNKNKVNSIKDLENIYVKAIKNADKPSGGGSSGGGSSSGGGGGVISQNKVTPSENINNDFNKKSIYNDLPLNHWGYNAVSYLNKMGVTEKGENLYPDKIITRFDFTKYITKAYKLEENKESEMNMSDVDKASELYKYIKPAFDNNIIKGISENYFGVDENIKREDAFVIIGRILENKFNVTLKGDNKTNFKDNSEISSYAVPTISALNKIGLIKGDGTYINPKGNITNVEALQLIYNAITEDEAFKKYFDEVVEKEFKESEKNALDVDYGYKQGGVIAEYVDPPKAHPIPDVINVMYKGEYLYFNNKPIMEQGRVMIPLRNIFEVFGGSVIWDGATNTATVTIDKNEIKLTVGNNKAYINNVEKELSVAPLVKDGRTYIPLRFLAEALNKNVEWNDSEKTVVIK